MSTTATTLHQRL